jgi:hypothetical protein
MRECALKAQVKSTIDMVVITLKKVQIMENQNTLTLLFYLHIEVCVWFAQSKTIVGKCHMLKGSFACRLFC